MLQDYAKSISLPEDRKSYDQVILGWNRYKASLAKALSSFSHQDLKTRLDSVRNKVGAVYRTEVKDRLAQMIKWNEAGSKVQTKRALAVSRTAFVLTLVMSMAAVLIGVASAAVVIRIVVTPIKLVSEKLASLRDNCVKHLCDALGALANGNLRRCVAVETIPMEVRSNDEVGAMAATCNDLLRITQGSIDAYDRARMGVNDLIIRIRASSATVGEASSMLSESSGQCETTAAEIALGSEKLAAAATEAAGVMQFLKNYSGKVKASSEDQHSLVREATDSLASGVKAWSPSPHRLKKCPPRHMKETRLF